MFVICKPRIAHPQHQVAKNSTVYREESHLDGTRTPSPVKGAKSVQDVPAPRTVLSILGGRIPNQQVRKHRMRLILQHRHIVGKLPIGMAPSGKREAHFTQVHTYFLRTIRLPCRRFRFQPDANDCKCLQQTPPAVRNCRCSSAESKSGTSSSETASSNNMSTASSDCNRAR